MLAESLATVEEIVVGRRLGIREWRLWGMVMEPRTRFELVTLACLEGLPRQCSRLLLIYQAEPPGRGDVADSVGYMNYWRVEE